MEQLSPAQQRVVKHPAEKGHVLVLAAPGSGKTRIITERAAALLSVAQVEPEHLLLMTFTIKAAAELLDRLGRRLNSQVQGIWAGTFHSICDRLLHHYGASIGWAPPFLVYDGPRQEDALYRAAASIGLVLENQRLLKEIKDCISQRKRLGLRGDEQRFAPPYDEDRIIEIDDAYRRLLQAERALDYDDLISYCIELLRQDPEAAASLRRRFRYVFVDEFHDVSNEQLELLKALVPPGSPQQHVFVVADPNQAIYGWRGADARRITLEFQRLYRPLIYELEENYRSVGNLVRAAVQVMTDGGAQVQSRNVLADGMPIYCVGCPDIESEARWLARQIERACDSGRYAYGDIAVLYRSHRRADALEAALLHAGIPLKRIQPERFFDHPDVQSTLRYLALAESLRDDSCETALSWPRVLVDELTMVHLRRLARSNNVSLSAVARHIDAYGDDVSPLTRVALEEFLAINSVDLEPVAGRPISVVVERLLAVLARRRSPIPAEIRADLAGVFEYLARPLQDAASQLHAAVESGRPVGVRYGPDLDSAAAAVVLEHVLSYYLQHPVQLLPASAVAPAGWLLISLGAPQPPQAEGFSLHIRDARSLRYSVATQAWRLGQLLLMRYETLRDGRYVICDLETTGLHVNTAEILELAAIVLDKRRPTGEQFHSMVRPQGPISADASEVHGIRWADVRDAPLPAEVLPQLLAFLGDAPLVGHKLETFDYPLLRRVARQEGLPVPENFSIDTLTLARRLLPNESHRLADLARQAGSQVQQTHRAADDARLNAVVFNDLLDRLEREKELDVLAEALPLVALSINSAAVPFQDENEWLAQAGARAAAAGIGDHLRSRLHHVFDEGWALLDAERWLQALPVPRTAADAQWEELAERWRAVIDQYCRTFADHSVRAFLQYAALAAPVDDQPDDQGRVMLMTIHAAKGLEWPLVFVLGAEDGTLPRWSAESPEEIDEERRVLYVAMTRAKERLCLTYLRSDRGHSKQLSRFLQRMPQELISRITVRD